MPSKSNSDSMKADTSLTPTRSTPSYTRSTPSYTRSTPSSSISSLSSTASQSKYVNDLKRITIKAARDAIKYANLVSRMEVTDLIDLFDYVREFQSRDDNPCDSHIDPGFKKYGEPKYHETLNVDKLEDGVYNFVCGSLPQKKTYRMRVGKGESRDEIGTGIKHFQLCTGKTGSSPLTLVYAGVLHKTGMKVKITPLSGRWAGLKDRVFQEMDRILSTGAENLGWHFDSDIINLLEEHIDNPQLQSFILESAMSRAMCKLLQLHKKNEGIEFDICWPRLISKYVSSSIVETEAAECWEDVYDVYR